MFNKIKMKTYALLRSTEKWTKTDMVYLAKGSAWISAGKITGTFTGFFLAIIYANFLAKEEYATYKYLISIAGMFSIFTLPGLETSLIKSIANGYEGTFIKAVKISLKWSLIGVAIAVITSIYYYINGNTTLALGFLVIAFTTPIIYCFNIGPVLQGKKLFKTSTIYNIVKSLSIFVLIALAAFFTPKAIPVLLASFAGTGLVQIIQFFLVLKKLNLNKKEDTECVPLGKHLSLMSVLGIIAEQIDKLLVWKFLGATELAIYSFATIPINTFADYLKSASIIAFPKIAQQNPELIKKTLPAKIYKSILILVIPIILYFIFSPLLFNIFFPAYADSVKYSQFFALSLLFFPQRLFTQALLSSSKTKYLYIIQSASPIIKICLFLLLIPMLKINGAILAILGTGLFTLIISIYYFKKI